MADRRAGASALGPDPITPRRCGGSPGGGPSPARRRGPRRPAAGATALEFGLVAPALVVLICGLLEAAWQGATSAALDMGTREASRFGATGNPTPDGLGGPPPATREAAVRAVVRARGGGLLAAGQLTVRLVAHPGDGATLATPGAGTVGSAGGPGDIVVYELTYDQQVATPVARLLWPGGAVTHRARAVVRNEPFPAATPDAP